MVVAEHDQHALIRIARTIDVKPEAGGIEAAFAIGRKNNAPLPLSQLG